MAENLTHWKKTMNPDYLGAWALRPGEEPILTIVSAGMEKVVGSDGKKEECLVIRYKEKVGPGKMIVNATNAKAITKVAGTPYIERWAGVQVQVYSDKVKAFGDVVDAIRVREFKPKAPEPIPNCSECQEPIQAAYGKSPAAMAQYTTKKYGAPLCASCAEKRAAALQAEQNPTEGEGNAE